MKPATAVALSGGARPAGVALLIGYMMLCSHFKFSAATPTVPLLVTHFSAPFLMT